MEHFPYLFAAYAVVWSVLFVYILSLDLRSRKNERELEELKRSLEKSTPRAPADTRN
jgi:CcmD family protein